MVLWSGMGMEAAASTSTRGAATGACSDRKSTRLNSSHLVISYAVFCLKKKAILEYAARRPRRTLRARFQPLVAAGPSKLLARSTNLYDAEGRNPVTQGTPTTALPTVRRA